MRRGEMVDPTDSSRRLTRMLIGFRDSSSNEGLPYFRPLEAMASTNPDLHPLPFLPTAKEKDWKMCSDDHARPGTAVARRERQMSRADRGQTS